MNIKTSRVFHKLLVPLIVFIVTSYKSYFVQNYFIIMRIVSCQHAVACSMFQDSALCGFPRTIHAQSSICIENFIWLHLSFSGKFDVLLWKEIAKSKIGNRGNTEGKKRKSEETIGGSSQQTHDVISTSIRPPNDVRDVV